MYCAKGIFAKGILGGTGFSLLQWEKGSEAPSCGGTRGLRLPRSLGRSMRNEGVSQTLLPTASFRPFFPSQKVGDRYDWTTGAPHDGNERKRYRVVPRAHPSRALLYAYFNRSGSKGAFSFPGATWDRFRCTVEPSPGHIRCRKGKTPYLPNPLRVQGKKNT